MPDIIQKTIAHPLLRPNLIAGRDYQINIAQTASNHNTLVVLPTSLGKTIIAILTIANTLQTAPESKILVMAPTRPLVQQHYDTFCRFFKSSVRLCTFTAGLSPTNRALSINDADIIFSTPQIIKNDLEADLYSLQGFGHIIFDEVHKARKRYNYVNVAAHYLADCAHPLILGLTASPGKDLYRINELCENLQIEQIVFRNQESHDVTKYVYPINTIIRKIDLPMQITQAKAILETAIRKIQDYLCEREILPRRRYSSKFQYIQLVQDLKYVDVLCDPYLSEDQKRVILQNKGYRGLNYPHLAELFDETKDSNEPRNSNTAKEGSNNFSRCDKKKPNKAATMGYAVNAIYLEHLKEILTTQDIRMYYTYINKLKERAKSGNSHLKRFLNSKYIKGVNKILETTKNSPKLDALFNIIREEIKQDAKAKLIVFTQYREMGRYIEQELNAKFVKGISTKFANRFVGQASKIDDPGLSQADQKQLIRQFAEGEFQIMIATSVAEEGLDIPNVNAVIFYDSVPSEIRLIQRRGRTGRHSLGRCYCLVSDGTLDEVYHNVSHFKENKMQKLLQHPEKINTVKEFPRSSQKPKYFSLSLEEIEKKRQIYKDQKELRKLEEIKIQLANHPKNNPKNIQSSASLPVSNSESAFSLINDMTLSISSMGQDRFLKNQKNLESSRQKAKLLSSHGITKKIFNWLISTMEISGEIKGNYLYCDLDTLFKEANKEKIDPIKIELTVDRCIKAGIFQTSGALLTYCFT